MSKQSVIPVFILKHIQYFCSITTADLISQNGVHLT